MLEIIILVLVALLVLLGVNFSKNNKKVIALQVELENSQNNNQVLAQNILAQQNKALNLEQQLQNLQTEFTKERTNNSFLQNQVIEKNNTINELNNKLNADQNILAQQNKAIAENKTSNTFLQNQLNEKIQIIQSLENQVTELTDRLNKARQVFTEKNTELQEKEKSFSEQKQNFDEMKQKLTLEFQNLANKILEDKTTNFKNTNKDELNHLLEPLKNKIDGFQNRMNEIHNKQVEDNSKLEKELQNVMNLGNNISKEASNLTQALKGNNKVMGNWGEMQLLTLLEKAGMQEGQQYTKQQVFNLPLADDDTKKAIPDVVINLPDAKNLIIDSKVSLIDFEKAVNADNEELKKDSLKAHIRSIKKHIDDLASKKYQTIQQLNSPDFVFMFIPLESALIEAVKFDTSLSEYGFSKNIFLVSQNSLLAMLKIVSSMWRLSETANHIKELQKSATEIYDTFERCLERLSNVGKSISDAQKSYESTIKAFSGQKGIFKKIDHFKRISSKANNEYSNKTSALMEQANILESQAGESATD